MKKEERIARYGEKAYEKQLELRRAWNEANPESHKQWEKVNPEKVEERNHNLNRKGGKYYEKKLEYGCTGIPGERNKIRNKHRHMWHRYKNLIAPDSQIHHSWRPRTAEYDGVALVEKDAHQHGFIDVIQILEGEITLLTEKEIKNAG